MRPRKFPAGVKPGDYSFDPFWSSQPGGQSIILRNFAQVLPICMKIYFSVRIHLYFCVVADFA
jgi:hypothetical protein